MPCLIFQKLIQGFFLANLLPAGNEADLRIGELEPGDREHDFSHGDDQILREEPEHVDRVVSREAEVGKRLLVAEVSVARHVDGVDASLTELQLAQPGIAGISTEGK